MSSYDLVLLLIHKIEELQQELQKYKNESDKN